MAQHLTVNRRAHYFMISALVIYSRDGQPRQRHMSLIVELNERKITASVLDQARNAAVTRAMAEGSVLAENIQDIVFLNISHLGHMTAREFQDMEQEEKSAPKQTKNVFSSHA